MDRPRQFPELDMLSIEVEYRCDGKHRLAILDSTSLVRSLAEGMFAIQPPEPLGDEKSIISGLPAVLYRTAEAELALTPDELKRLAFRSLRPDEFEAIIRYAGCTYELNADFYDGETGIAKNPII